MTTHEKHEENVRKLREMIEGIEFAMLTTADIGCLLPFGTMFLRIPENQAILRCFPYRS